MAASVNTNNDHTVVYLPDPSINQLPPQPQPPKPKPKPVYTAKPKSRIADLPQPSEPTPNDDMPPPDPLEVDDKDVVRNATSLKAKPAPRGKLATILLCFELAALAAITALMITSLTVETLKDTEVWSLDLWRLCVLALVVVCGRLFTEWLTKTLVFLSEKNFLLQTKLLYFIFSMKSSVCVVIWLALILGVWLLLVNGGGEEGRRRRSRKESRVLSKITRGIVSTLVGAVMWMVKTLLVKLVASVFQARTFFDRIKELIFNHHILQALWKKEKKKAEEEEEEGLEKKDEEGSEKKEEGLEKKEEGLEKEVNLKELWKVDRENVSAWTMEGLMNVVTETDSLTVKTEVLDDGSTKKAITNEARALEAGGRIFRRVAKDKNTFIEEGDMKPNLSEEEVEGFFLKFEGAAESRRIEQQAFVNWVAEVYSERKCLSITLTDAKTAIEELNRIASCFVLILILIVWILIMEIVTTSVLVFISSQLLILVFMFGNSAKMLFEALIFIFVVHPIDVGDRCVIDGEQMMVEEMNILTTIFLKANNEKLYYPNSVLATKMISNYNRSPEMMVDVIEFTLDFSTSGSLDTLKDKIKRYLESKPEYWRSEHSVQVKDIPEINKMIIVLFVTHTMNFQNHIERGIRKSDLVIQLQIFREEM